MGNSSDKASSESRSSAAHPTRIEEEGEANDSARFETPEAPKTDRDMQEMMPFMDEANEFEQASKESKSGWEQSLRESEARAALERAKQKQELFDLINQSSREHERLRKEHEEIVKNKIKSSEIRESENQKKFEERIDAIDEEFVRVTVENATMLEQSTEFLEQLREQHKREREHSDRAFAEYCSYWRAQMGNFMVMMRQKEWSRKIEKKWSERLDSLKEWFTPIREAFASLSFSVTTSVADDLADNENIELKTSILMEKAQRIREVMENEMEDMQRMLEEHPEAAFLTDIEESAKVVRESALELIEKLVWFKGESDGSSDLWELCVDAYNDLEKKVYLIPTVELLKEKHANEL